MYTCTIESFHIKGLFMTHNINLHHLGILLLYVVPLPYLSKANYLHPL